MIKDNNFEKYSLETFENLSKTIKKFSKNIDLEDFEKYLKTDFYENRVLFLGGDQIEGSLSPFIHNYSSYLNKSKLFYTLFRYGIENTTPKDFLEILKSKNDILGANITMPYKKDMFDLLKNENSLDNSAKIVGAVNTIIKKDGKILGLNTDIDGIINPILEKDIDLNNKTGYILGAGGASMAVIAGLLKLGIKKIKIFVRDIEKSGELKKYFYSIKNLFQTDFEIEIIKYDLENGISNMSDYINEKGILINTLPFGFKNGFPKSPILYEEFDKISENIELYFDIVYDLNHEMTPMSEYIGKNYKDIKLIFGIEMLLHQAQTGFMNWTNGKKLDLKLLENIMKN